MEGITLTIGTRQLLFARAGTVADAASRNVLGAWRSNSDQKDNQIRYAIGGAEQTPLPAVYAFNDSNQLQMQLRGQNGKLSDPLVFVGGIEIDENHDLNYVLVDNTGTPTGNAITVYGNLHFAQDTNNLAIDLSGGGQTEIQGLTGVASLQAAKNHIATFKGDDLLTFHAETDNEIPGQENLVVVPAKIQFTGGWDIQNGSLVFLSNINSDPGRNAINIGFAGKLAGVTAGFVYFADAGKTQAALNISGQHVFRAGKATTDLAWESSIGFTGKTFSAQVSVNSVTNLPGGQVLGITGGLTLLEEGGGKVDMDLALQAQYSFDAHNILVFKAMVTDGEQYDLMLQGTFQYSNMSLTFKADYTNQQGAQDLHVAVGVQGNRDSLVKNVALVLDIEESQAKLQLSASFEVHLQFADGVRVKTKALPAAAPQAITAGAGSGHTS